MIVLLALLPLQMFLLDDLKDSVDYYLEKNEADDLYYDEEMYTELGVEEIEEGCKA